MIKIITGYSLQGGSTTAHMNLVNAFNEFGLDACLYGPHNYPEDKCKFELLPNFKPFKTDTIIVHFLDVPKLNCKKMIYSSHESDLDPLWKKELTHYSKIHYVSRWQQQFHNVKKSYTIIPNILEDLKPNTKPNIKIGGVIGSIDRNKQTHKSIIDALNDGCEKIYLFGNVTDINYYNEYVKNLINDDVILYGFSNNKQEMYNMITDVYQNSVRETWGYVAGECELTGTKYHSNGMCNFEFLSKLEIIEKWRKIL